VRNDEPQQIAIAQGESNTPYQIATTQGKGNEP